MNRTEFMDQLEILLQNISVAEKEEALQYYNDYFDDAGAENEQSVIEALGNPARVAENIRRDLLENQGGRSSTASDRAVVEYGKADLDESTGDVPAAVSGLRESGNITGSGGSASGQTASADGSSGFGGNTGFGGNQGSGGSSGFGGNQGSGGSSGFGGNQGSGGSPGYGGEPGAGGKSGMSGGMIALITVLIVFASPIILGMLCIMIGLLAMWFALILSFGAVVLSMLTALIALLIVGGMCIPVDPLVGMALIGGGLVCGGVGILFLMLTAAMAGIATPAIFRGIGHLFRFRRKEAAA